MTTRPRTTRGEAVGRAVPWSTRAVILLAFAIQLGPASARLDPAGVRSIECLTLCDGQLLPLWFADSGSPGEGAAEAVALTRLGVSAVLPGRPDAGHPLPGVDFAQVGWAVLPLPPPAAC